MYARLHGIPPHDPSIDRLSAWDLDVYIRAWFEFNDRMSGQSKRQFENEVERARERFKKMMNPQATPITPEELGWEETTDA